MKNKFEIGDICYVLQDDIIKFQDRADYINKLGKVYDINKKDNVVLLKFTDGYELEYWFSEVRLATEYESDKFYLERYKYV